MTGNLVKPPTDTAEQATTATDRAVERDTENAGALYRSLADMQIHLYE